MRMRSPGPLTLVLRQAQDEGDLWIERLSGRFYRITDKGLVIHLRVTPNAGLDRIEGVEVRDDGQAVLRLRVKAVPDKGKANQAVMALVADALGIAKGRVSLIAGETARLKTVAVAGDGPVLADRLAKLPPLR